MTTRTEYGYRKDCEAQGCDPPCSDRGWVHQWVLTGEGTKLSGRPPSTPRWIEAEQRFGVHLTRWVSRTITVSDWAPVGDSS